MAAPGRYVISACPVARPLTGAAAPGFGIRPEQRGPRQDSKPLPGRVGI